MNGDISMTQDPLIISQGHGTTWVTLNRPKALNALNIQMMRGMKEVLQKTQEDLHSHALVIQGAGPKAFCAGGDLRSVYDAICHQDEQFLHDIFATEYSANLRSHQFKKPHVACIQGYVMGGGMGASIHGSHRIVTDSTRLAMPETKIGYFPDVGASYFLNRCPGALGLYLGLTGVTIAASDALDAGWATHYIPQSFFEVFCERIQEGQGVDEALQTYEAQPSGGSLSKARHAIDTHFSKESLQGIFESLRSDADDFAQETLMLLKKRCPLSLHVTFQQLKACANKSFEACMHSEFHLSQVFVKTHDFKEGIRAVIIDKDHEPQWQHPSIHQVQDRDLYPFFDQGEARFHDAPLQGLTGDTGQ